MITKTEAYRDSEGNLHVSLGSAVVAEVEYMLVDPDRNKDDFGIPAYDVDDARGIAEWIVFNRVALERALAALK